MKKNSENIKLPISKEQPMGVDRSLDFRKRGKGDVRVFMFD